MSDAVREVETFDHAEFTASVDSVLWESRRGATAMKLLYRAVVLLRPERTRLRLTDEQVMVREAWQHVRAARRLLRQVRGEAS